MPQMAPLLWLYLFLFFLISLMLFLIISFFIKPFETMPVNYPTHNISQKTWKL